MPFIAGSCNALRRSSSSSSPSIISRMCIVYRSAASRPTTPSPSASESPRPSTSSSTASRHISRRSGWRSRVSSSIRRLCRGCWRGRWGVHQRTTPRSSAATSTTATPRTDRSGRRSGKSLRVGSGCGPSRSDVRSGGPRRCFSQRQISFQHLYRVCARALSLENGYRCRGSRWSRTLRGSGCAGRSTRRRSSRLFTLELRSTTLAARRTFS